MGLFRRVDVASEALRRVGEQRGTERRPIRLRVTVEEWPALRLRYGFQVAERRPEDSVRGATSRRA